MYFYFTFTLLLLTFKTRKIVFLYKQEKNHFILLSDSNNAPAASTAADLHLGDGGAAACPVVGQVPARDQRGLHRLHDRDRGQLVHQTGGFSSFNFTFVTPHCSRLRVPSTRRRRTGTWEGTRWALTPRPPSSRPPSSLSLAFPSLRRPEMEPTSGQRPLSTETA